MSYFQNYLVIIDRTADPATLRTWPEDFEAHPAPAHPAPTHHTYFEHFEHSEHSGHQSIASSFQLLPMVVVTDFR
jgi:hypothetical protein